MLPVQSPVPDDEQVAADLWPVEPSIVIGPAVGENAVVDIFSVAACAAGARASAVIATTTPLTADKLA